MTHNKKNGLILWLFSCLFFAAMVVSFPPNSLCSWFFAWVGIVILTIVWPITWLKTEKLEKPEWEGI